MLENRVTVDFIEHTVDYDEYDRRMEALAQKEDEEWEDFIND